MKKTAPRSTMVLMPLPSGGKLHYEVHHFLTHMRMRYAQEGVAYYEQIIAGLDQPQCRAELLAFYYRNREHFEQVVWLDSDTIVAPETFLDLGRLHDPIVGIPYEQRRRDEVRYPEGSIQNWALSTNGQDAHPEVREGRRMMAVAGMGMGCVRMTRDAVEHLWAWAKEQQSQDMQCRHEFAPREFFWASHLPGMIGTEVCGLFEPIVHKHLDGIGEVLAGYDGSILAHHMRRRPEDMSFFLRACASGLQPYVLCDATVWHDGKGGKSLWDCLTETEKEKDRQRRRVDFELVDCPDNLLGLHEVLDGAYEIHGLQLEPGEVILDLGANVGAFAVWASKRFPGAEIHCYEPEPQNFEKVAQRMWRGILPLVATHPVAVTGKKRGPLRLSPGKFNDGEWTLHPVEGNHVEERSVEVQTMPASELPACSVLKLDTEGCEREILENYPEKFWPGVKAVMCEWHSGDDYAWIMGAMRERGFLPMVDRARGKPLPDRELCFLRRDVYMGLEKAAAEEVKASRESNGQAHAEVS